jgi:hypothetical protein
MSTETLESLVAEFEAGTAAPSTPAPSPPPQSQPPQLEQVERERHQRDAAAAEAQHRQNERALSQAVQQFKRASDLTGESDTLVEGYLLARSRRDPSFSDAVSSGDARRAEAALSAARRDYQAEISGNYIESDTLRARASVRASDNQPEVPEFTPLQVSQMSDSEYDAYMAKRLGTQSRPPNTWTGDSRSVAASPWAAHDRPGAGGGPQAKGQASSRSRPLVGRR